MKNVISEFSRLAKSSHIRKRESLPHKTLAIWLVNIIHAMSSHNPAQRTSAPADSHPVAGSSAGLVIDHDIDISLANCGTVVSTDESLVVFDDHGG